MKKHVFFDLDHTLWDFEKNAEACLQEIYSSHLSTEVPYNAFIETFRVINKALWRQLEKNAISHEFLRKTRFGSTLEKLGVPCSAKESLAMNDQFMELLPTQKSLVEGAEEILEYLFPSYPLHIISNGYLDIQTKKMSQSGILPYFQQIITSDVSGSRKPDRKIFDYALTAAGVSLDQVVYIGDDEIADRRGSANAGWKFIHFSPAAPASDDPSIIRSLLALKDLL